MNRSQSRVLIVLRDCGSLNRDVCFVTADLRRQDRSVVCKVRRSTIADLIVAGWLEERTFAAGVHYYGLTAKGAAIARSVRNTVTP